ncbi:MAG: transmembrane anchored protein [Cyanobacteria bacterium REEB494]|nr:transmembrane anchored protein [Cyanobacteria bacterium REEB494]
MITSCSGGTSRNTSGLCDSPSDTAADGSRCGGRAASVRPGGR